MNIYGVTYYYVETYIFIYLFSLSLSREVGNVVYSTVLTNFDWQSSWTRKYLVSRDIF